jgi:transcriptional regulator with XRE-family HTH domain
MALAIRITYHIRRWRLRRHLGQAALGAQVGLSASTISAYEHGAVDIPTSRLCRLAQALRVTLNDLVTWTEAPAPPGGEPPI